MKQIVRRKLGKFLLTLLIGILIGLSYRIEIWEVQANEELLMGKFSLTECQFVIGDESFIQMQCKLLPDKAETEIYCENTILSYLERKDLAK